MVTLRTALPAAPQRNDGRDDFSDDADAFAAAMVVDQALSNAQIQESNALALRAEAAATSAVNAPGTSATSTTTLTVGTGSKALAIQTGKAFTVGQFVTIADPATPGRWMHGQITAYTSGTGALVVLIGSFAGSGTATSWIVALTAPIITSPMATAATVWAGTSSTDAVSPKALFDAMAYVALADGPTITPNFSAGINFAVTLGGNRFIANPTGIHGIQQGSIEIKQPPAGSCTIIWDSWYDFGLAGAPVLSKTPGAVDVIDYRVRSSTKVRIFTAKGFT